MKKIRGNIENNKDGKIFFKVIILLLLIICAILFFLYYEFSKINVSDLDESDLSINENMYEDVSDLVSKSEFKCIVNIVLFGSDSRNINDAATTKKIKLISIPRDSYVNVPGYGYTKINHAYAYGGEQLTIKTINSNFDLDISEYITINFAGLINIVNEIGGIDLEITEAERDAINEYLKESYDVSGNEYVPMTEYGKVTLNGEQALSHARDRHVGSDFARATRQREVLTAIMNKVSNFNIFEITSIITNDFFKEVKTNVDMTKYTYLFADIILNKNKYLENITSVQVPSTEYGYDKYIYGTYYYCFDDDTAKADLYNQIYGK
jgi:LCP family protein required for cell wall assembly